MISYEKIWDMPVMTAAQRGQGDDKTEPYSSQVMGNIIYAVVGLICKVAFRYNAEGLENFRQFAGKQGCVVVSAHRSFLDPVFLWLTARPSQWIRFMARENIFPKANGLLGWICSKVGAFPIKRDSADRTAIKRAAAMLKRGENVGIFPEGTRRGRGTTKLSLHSGAAFIARMGKAPMVPTGIRNVENIKPPEARLVRFPKVTVVYGTPVNLEDFDFLPKAERLDAASWYVMRECYALHDGVPREDVDMASLFPEAKDYTQVFAEHAIP